MKNVLTQLAKNVLVPSGLTAAASAKDATIQKKIFGSWHPLDIASRTAALIISDKEMEDIMKIVESLKESGLLIKGVSEIIKNESKEQNGGFFGMLLGTLAASLLGGASADNGVIRGGDGVIRTGEGVIRVGQDF